MKKGYRIGNLDALIMIERPKMAPHIQKMRENVAMALHCDMDAVSIKSNSWRKDGICRKRRRSTGTVCSAFNEEIKIKRYDLYN